MPLVTDESSEKRDSFYLRYEPENQLFLKSHLYKIPYHYLQNIKKSVICKEKECTFCEQGLQKRMEYNYYVSLNGQLGVIDIKPSVFFSIQTIAKSIKKDLRDVSWLVIKTGQGLETEYTVSKNDNLTEEESTQTKMKIASLSDKLTKLMSVREKILEENYKTNGGTIEVKPEVKDLRQEKVDAFDKPEKPEEEGPPPTNEDDMPF